MEGGPFTPSCRAALSGPPATETFMRFAVIAASAAIAVLASGQAHKVVMAFQQTSAEPTTRSVIDRFNAAFNRHDADAVAALLTDDTVFEDTSPPPDGRRIAGKAAVAAFWRDWFARNA